MKIIHVSLQGIITTKSDIIICQLPSLHSGTDPIPKFLLWSRPWKESETPTRSLTRSTGNRFLEPYNGPGVETGQFQISKYHTFKTKNELSSPNQGRKECCKEISNAEILHCQMFLSSCGLITLAPMPLIITCH